MQEIFLHNSRQLINTLPQLGYHGDNTPDEIRAFLEENRDRFKVEISHPQPSLIDFVNFKDTTTLNIPKLKLCAAISEVVRKNASNENLNNANIEQFQAIGQVH
ncbi:MAG: hypothetical protein ACR5KV_06605 [Wolbachia sp.]